MQVIPDCLSRKICIAADVRMIVSAVTVVIISNSCREELMVNTWNTVNICFHMQLLQVLTSARAHQIDRHRWAVRLAACAMLAASHAFP